MNATPARLSVRDLVIGHRGQRYAGPLSFDVDAGKVVCQSAVCDVRDNGCGYDVGQGPCTQMNAAVVCRSDACSAR